jgi:hypothetical protein
MFIKQKRVRKSEQFTPRYIKSDKHRRELTISHYSTTLIHFALGIALLIISYQSFLIFHSKVNDLSTLQKYALPLAFLLGGGFCLRGSIGKFRRIRAEHREVEEFYREETEES